MMRRLTLLVAMLCLFLHFDMNAYGAPLVSYETTGVSGNWTLNFSVTNNLGGNSDIYIFGVKLPQYGISATPTGWNAYPTGSLWDLSVLGGSTTPYNNIWQASYNDQGIDYGQTLSGFHVALSAELAPTSVNWMSYAVCHESFIYTGSDAISGNMQFPGTTGTNNPIFEGVAQNSATVPEPTTMLLLGLGLMGLAGVRRKFKK